MILISGMLTCINPVYKWRSSKYSVPKGCSPSRTPFPFAPSLVADRAQVYEKYSVLTRNLPRAPLHGVFDRVQALEDQADLGRLSV